ncbi:MAG: hypothetical protein ACK5PB_00050 [Pirellula sp.]
MVKQRFVCSDSFSTIEFPNNSNTDEKMTCEGVVCGIADILVATLATTTGDRELDDHAFRDVTAVEKLDSGHRGTNLKA